MPSISRAGLLFALACFGAACSDSTGTDLEPSLVQDTVTIAAPLPQNAGLPTALDITASGTEHIEGGRFPELSRDALEWDFAVRIEDGQLVLAPPMALGVLSSMAGITHPLEGETFESLGEMPSLSKLVRDTAMVMEVGRVYAARSRDVSRTVGTCVQFAKLEPLEVNVPDGLLRVQIVTNRFCGDPRLVPLD